MRLFGIDALRLDRLEDAGQLFCKILHPAARLIVREPLGRTLRFREQRAAPLAQLIGCRAHALNKRERALPDAAYNTQRGGRGFGGHGHDQNSVGMVSQVIGRRGLAKG
jgi:hypothetical protein